MSNSVDYIQDDPVVDVFVVSDEFVTAVAASVLVDDVL